MLKINALILATFILCSCPDNREGMEKFTSYGKSAVLLTDSEGNQYAVTHSHNDLYNIYPVPNNGSAGNFSLK